MSALPHQAVLQLGLQVAVEAVAHTRVYAPSVTVPRDVAALAVRDLSEQRLVPAQRAEPLWRDLVLGLDVVGHRIAVLDGRHLGAGGEKLAPYLEVAPGVRGVGAEERVRVVADVLARRKRAGRGFEQVAAVAPGHCDLPRRPWGPADVPRDGRMVPLSITEVPLAGP